MRHGFSVVWIGLSLWLAASSPAAQTPNCPNVRASQVDARVTHEGASHRCGIGISILGIGGGIFGPSCHERTFTYPSHQECRGEQSPGLMCEPTGRLPVQSERCQCARATVLGTGFLIPSCNCTPADGGGEIEDAATMPCKTIIEDPRKA